MIYFTSDLHLNHTNVIRFCNRPFKDVLTMNRHIIDSWNKVVTVEDEVYMLGDFALRSTRKTARYFLHKLNGKKYFIKGNHDKTDYFDNFKNVNLIEWWKEHYEFSYIYNDKTYDFSLNHYPHYPIDDKMICLHGHVHGAYEHRGKTQYHTNILDVGVDNIGYEPISIIEVIKLIEKRYEK